MEPAITATKIEQGVETWLERRLLHLADQDEMVASVVDRMVLALKHRQGVSKQRHAMLAQRPGRAAEAVLDPGPAAGRSGGH